jgi:hypothetical protein
MTNDAEQAIDHALVTVTSVYSREARAAAKKAGTLQGFELGREQVRVLLGSTQPGLDQRMLDMVADDCPAKDVLCRILAERDPDRDPQYALDAVLGKGGLYSRWLGKRVFRFAGAAVMPVYGIDRLRRLKPVEHLTRETTRWSAPARSMALARLGDTADPAAVPVVIKPLTDKSSLVRPAAVGAIRSLYLTGALTSVESVADVLVEQLTDGSLMLVEAAAGALVDLGLSDRLIRDGLASPSAVKIVDLALDGRVCVPKPMWPGHEGYDSEYKHVLHGGGRHP